MLSFEELQNIVSAEKQLLSYAEFQNQVLEAFNCTKEECEFCDLSYAFFADVGYRKYQWVQFAVKYVRDPENCNYGRWIIVKRYNKVCKDISDSLIQGIKVLEQKTEESIKEEIAVFKHIEK